jgi:hypothetical protein
MTYAASYFDPATGEQKTINEITATDQPSQVEPPLHGHDWVLVLEAKR